MAITLHPTFIPKAIGDITSVEKASAARYVYLTEMGQSGEKVVKMEQFLDPERVLGHVLGKAERCHKLYGHDT